MDPEESGPVVPEPAGKDKNLLLVKICAGAGAVAAIAGVVVGCSVPVLNMPSLPKLPANFPSLPNLPSLPNMPTNFPTNLPPGFPTNLPPGFPTSLPSGYPTDLPSIPTMPNMPAPPGGW